MSNITRKKFFRKSLLLLSGASFLGACTNSSNEKNIESPNVHTKKKYKWRMVTTWPPNFPILGEGCNVFSEWVKKASGGRLEIQVFGAGELIPALQAFDAVSSGTAELGSGVSYYWAGKAPATQFFATVPFGMNAQLMNTWLEEGNGMKLWRELYDQFNLVPFNCGNTGVQMGGWFNKSMDSPDDFRGLKMRIPGLGGKVIEKLGGAAVLLAGGEIFTGLERGVIDATEWIGPFHDYKMGFHKIAKYYYSPGWHEPGAVLEMFINKQKLQSLPDELQYILEFATAKLNLWTLAAFEKQNATFLNKIYEEGNVEIRTFSNEILEALRENTKLVINEICAGDAFSQKVYEDYSHFMNNQKRWANMTEKNYYDNIM